MSPFKTMKEIPPLEHDAEKRAFWNHTLVQLDRIVDGLGRPMDPGIKETVVAFMVNGFPTRGSCEGHLEDRFGKKIKLCPFVAVGFDEPAERFMGDTEIKRRIAADFQMDVANLMRDEAARKAYWDYIEGHLVQETEEYLSVRARNEALQVTMSILLETFYKDRQVPNERKIVIEPVGPAGHFWVNNNIKTPQRVSRKDTEKYRKILLEEQKEMQALTERLKERFFG